METGGRRELVENPAKLRSPQAWIPDVGISRSHRMGTDRANCKRQLLLDHGAVRAPAGGLAALQGARADHPSRPARNSALPMGKAANARAPQDEGREAHAHNRSCS